MKIIACSLFAVVLAGCASAPPEPPKVIEVDKPVAVSCLGAIPVRPLYVYGKGTEPSDIEKGAILIKDFEAAEQYGIAWEAAAAGCLTLAPRPSAHVGKQAENPPLPD